MTKPFVPPRPERPLLSVVIPAYNEATRIVGSLEQVSAFLAEQPFTWEVLVMDDGSADATAELVAAFAAEHPGIRLERLPHGGKGAALKAGMARARGEYRFICDADLSMPIEQVTRFLPDALGGEFDVAIASRELSGSRRIDEPARRHLMGRVFNGLVQLLAVRGLADTQCGFKCFRGEVAEELFAYQLLGGWAFDVELLFIARLRGYGIQEVPIDWYYRAESKVRPVRDALTMAGDLLRLRWNHLRGRYRARGAVPAPAAVPVAAARARA